MFEYVGKSAHGISVSLGRYLKKELVWLTQKNELIPCEEVNGWDRRVIALKFYEYWRSNGNELPHPEDKEQFLLELAIKIDELIPKHYFNEGVACGAIKKHYDFEPEPKYYKRWQSPYTRELVFVYPMNETKERGEKDYNPSFINPSYKQLDYLKGLIKPLNLKLRTDVKITKEDCSLLINYFLGNVPWDRWIALAMRDYLKPKYKQHDYQPLIDEIESFLEDGEGFEIETTINKQLLIDLDEDDSLYLFLDLLKELQMLNLKHAKRLTLNKPIIYLNYCDELLEGLRRNNIYSDEGFFHQIWNLHNEFELVHWGNIHEEYFWGYDESKDYIVISEDATITLEESKDVIILDFSSL